MNITKGNNICCEIGATNITNKYHELEEELNTKFGFCWKVINKKKWKDGSNCVRSSKTYGRWNK